jgi:hypothetical protein
MVIRIQTAAGCLEMSGDQRGETSGSLGDGDQRGVAAEPAAM